MAQNTQSHKHSCCFTIPKSSWCIIDRGFDSFGVSPPCWPCVLHSGGEGLSIRYQHYKNEIDT